MVSFTRPNLGFIEYQIVILESPQNQPVRIEIDSKLMGMTSNLRVEEDPRVGSKFSQHPYTITRQESTDQGAAFTIATKRSRLAAAVRVWNEISIPGEPLSAHRENETLINRWSGLIAPSQAVTLRKYMAYGMAPETEGDRLWDLLKDELDRGIKVGFSNLQKEQEEFLSNFWASADVEIEGDPAIQQALRFNIFHILQSSGRNGNTSIAAKGLTGEGYEGHYFWDTEINVCPLLTYTAPELARNLLTFRHSILNQARSRASLMSEQGALFPWRTINGEETSAYYPAGTAQYHINADIVYAMEKYCAASEDRQFPYGPHLGSRGRDIPPLVFPGTLRKGRKIQDRRCHGTGRVYGGGERLYPLRPGNRNLSPGRFVPSERTLALR
jgi:alpha,alpha-trehalose phosphorylase